MRITIENCVSELASRNARLRDISPVYPEVHEEIADGEITLSTWAPFEYEGVHYQRHCIETAILGGNPIFGGKTTPQDVYDRLRGVAVNIKIWAKPYLKSDPIFGCILDKIVEPKQLPAPK